MEQDPPKPKTTSDLLREFAARCRDKDSRVGTSGNEGFVAGWASHTRRHDGAFYPLTLFTEAADELDLRERLIEEMQTMIDDYVPQCPSVDNKLTKGAQCEGKAGHPGNHAAFFAGGSVEWPQ